jgi:hypothetical protein
MALVFRLVLRAQRYSPPRIERGGLMLALIPFFLFVSWWGIWLSSLFGLPK